MQRMEYTEALKKHKCQTQTLAVQKKREKQTEMRRMANAKYNVAKLIFRSIATGCCQVNISANRFIIIPLFLLNAHEGIPSCEGRRLRSPRSNKQHDIIIRNKKEEEEEEGRRRRGRGSIIMPYYNIIMIVIMI